MSRLHTPKEEPDAEVRRWIAQRLPVDRLAGLPTPEEEPDDDVRWWIALRLPIERLLNMPMPENEPDIRVYQMLQMRKWRIFNECY